MSLDEKSPVIVSVVAELRADHLLFAAPAGTALFWARSAVDEVVFDVLNAGLSGAAAARDITARLAEKGYQRVQFAQTIHTIPSQYR